MDRTLVVPGDEGVGSGLNPSFPGREGREFWTKSQFLRIEGLRSGLNPSFLRKRAYVLD
jgi:hypothetical protein